MRSALIVAVLVLLAGCSGPAASEAAVEPEEAPTRRLPADPELLLRAIEASPLLFTVAAGRTGFLHVDMGASSVRWLYGLSPAPGDTLYFAILGAGTQSPPVFDTRQAEAPHIVFDAAGDAILGQWQFVAGCPLGPGATGSVTFAFYAEKPGATVRIGLMAEGRDVLHEDAAHQHLAFATEMEVHGSLPEPLAGATFTAFHLAGMPSLVRQAGDMHVQQVRRSVDGMHAQDAWTARGGLQVPSSGVLTSLLYTARTSGVVAWRSELMSPAGEIHNAGAGPAPLAPGVAIAPDGVVLDAGARWEMYVPVAAGHATTSADVTHAAWLEGKGPGQLIGFDLFRLGFLPDSLLGAAASYPFTPCGPPS
jgi:hypothetical protein